MRMDLPLHPSAIIFVNVFSFSKELDQETLRMSIFLAKDYVKGKNLLKILWMPFWIWSVKRLTSPLRVSHARAFLFPPHGTSLMNNQSEAKSLFFFFFFFLLFFFTQCGGGRDLVPWDENCENRSKGIETACLCPAQHCPTLMECFSI